MHDIFTYKTHQQFAERYLLLLVFIDPTYQASRACWDWRCVHCTCRRVCKSARVSMFINIVTMPGSNPPPPPPPPPWLRGVFGDCF